MSLRYLEIGAPYITNCIIYQVSLINLEIWALYITICIVYNVSLSIDVIVGDVTITFEGFTERLSMMKYRLDNA